MNPANSVTQDIGILIDAQAAKLKHQANTPSVLALQHKGGGKRYWEFTPNQWSSLEGIKNIKARKCVLDMETKAASIINVVASEGACIPEHTHGEAQWIFVMDGAYKDTCTGNVYRAGDVQEIQPGEPHAFESDYALVTILWRPRLPDLDIPKCHEAEGDCDD
jgi:quercetin dioxygenase-like cupin family protein